MDQILKNAALFINVLGMSRTSEIQQWDVRELNRAFKWADYFQHVYLKLETRQAQREVLDQELKHQSCLYGAQVGISILQFKNLRDAKQILCQNILQNVWCSTEIYTETIKLYYTASEVNRADQLLSEDLKEITQMCCISNMLRPIGLELLKTYNGLPQKDRISKDQKDCANMVNDEVYKSTDANTILDFEKDFSKQVQGRLFRDYIEKCLGCKDSEAGLISHIDAILESRNDGWYLLWCICNEVDKSGPEFIQFIAKLVKEKLIPKWKSNHARFMDIPAPFALDIALLSEDIFLDYLRILYDCTDSYDQQSYTEELFLVSRLRENPAIDCMKLQVLEKHFEELNARKEHCIGFLRKTEEEFLTSIESKNNQQFFRMTWDGLSLKYLLPLSK